MTPFTGEGRMLSLLLMLACGESVTFEEEPVEAEVEAVEDVPADDYEPVTVPLDGRPDTVEVKSDGSAPASPKPGEPPPTGQPWPPIVIPQDRREREWDWDFKAGGTVKEPEYPELTQEDREALEDKR